MSNPRITPVTIDSPAVLPTSLVSANRPTCTAIPRLLMLLLLSMIAFAGAQTTAPAKPPVTFPAASGRQAGQAYLAHRLKSRQLPDDAVEAIRRSSTTAAGPPRANADFLGNLTGIGAPSGDAVVLARETSCSLTLFAVTYSYSATGISYSSPGPIYNFEQTLHKEASLATTPDVFANGCKDPVTGVASRNIIYLGQTTSSPPVRVGAFAGYVVSQGHNIVYTFVTSPTGIFKSQALQPINLNPESIVGGDLNGDGIADLVSINDSTSSATVTVLLGNADGSFQAGVDYAIPGDKVESAVIDDVNGDGKLDVIVASTTASSTPSSTDQISVLTGKGDGTLNPAQSFSVTDPVNQGPVPIANLITADLRGIGKKDIIVSNGIVLLNNGDGTFSAAPNPAFPAADNSNLAAGDVNKDGHIDLVVDENGTVVSIYLGKGDGTFTAGNSYASIGNQGYVTVTDLDGDGNPDIYTGIANGGVFGGDSFDPNLAYAFMGNGDGTFQGALSLPVSYDGSNLGDINGDGKPDLVTTNGTSFTPYLGNGNGTFTAGTPLQVPTSFVLGGQTYTETTAGSLFALADVNGDGKADLIFTAGVGGLFQYSNEPIYFVALSNGNGSFAAPVPAAMSLVAAGNHDYEDTLYALQAADFNGDGHTDLVFTYNAQSYESVYSQGFVILLGNGDGTFKAPILQTAYSSTTAPAYHLGPQIAAIGDVNNDHKPDLMVIAATSTPNTQLQPNTQMELLLGNGDGTFGKPSVISTATNPVLPIDAPSPAILADMNSDGRLDLLCLGDTTAGQGQLAISLGNGDGTFGAPSILNTTDGEGNVISQDGLAVADFNGDGKLDIAVASFDASASGIYFGNGDGTITSYNSNSPINVFNLAVFGSTVAADFNGDGKADLLSGSTLLLNIYGTAATLSPSTTSLSASAASVTAGASVGLTATVSGTGGAPTGTVTFLDGSTKLGTGALSSAGQATYSTSSLAVGAHSITAAYGGDANFAASTSSAVTVTVTAAAPPDFSLSLSPASASVSPGSTATSSVSITPSGGFNSQVSFACTGLPVYSTCAFLPATVTPSGSGAASTTLTVATNVATASIRGSNRPDGRRAGAGETSLALILLGLSGLVSQRRKWSGFRWRTLLSVLLVAGVSIGVVACGGGGSSSGGSATTSTTTPAGTSTVTVTATAGGLSKTASLTLTVQ
jgi:Bacterial Ig-like domain (group 3)/FG-GAP-like repeat